MDTRATAPARRTLTTCRLAATVLTACRLAALLPALGAGHIGAAEPAVTASDEERRAILGRFFAEADAAARRPLAERFAAVAPADWAAVKRLLHESAPRPALEPGPHEFQTPGDEFIPSIHYILRVPPDYQPNAADGWPLVMTCHWTDSTAKRALSWVEGVLGPDIDRYLVACPASPDPGVYRSSRQTDMYPLDVLADVRRRANVDSDRCLLTGYSRGGYQTWATSLFSPGEWAGAAPLASCPTSQAGLVCCRMYLENVLHLSMQAHWGDQDILRGETDGINTLSRAAADWFKAQAAEHFEPVEYKGQGHDLDLKREMVRAFLARVRRDPFPRQFRYLFHRMYQGQAYYVTATKAATPELDFRERVPIRGGYRPEDVRRTFELTWTRKGYHLAVSMPEGENLIVVTARNLRDVEVDLPVERLDFSRPIRVTANGTRRAGPAGGVDWVCLLETVRQTYDFERLIGGRVTVPTGR